MLQLNHKKFANVFCGWSLLMAFLGSKISLFAFQFFLIFNSLKSSVKILWRSVEKRTKENEWLSMVHLPIYFLESMSGSLNVSKQIYSFVWVSFLIASSIPQSHMFVLSSFDIFQFTSSDWKYFPLSKGPSLYYVRTYGWVGRWVVKKMAIMKWKCPYLGGWVVQKSLKIPLRSIKMAPNWFIFLFLIGLFCFFQIDIFPFPFSNFLYVISKIRYSLAVM